MARATGMHYKAKGEMMGELRGKHSVASIRAFMSLILNQMNQVGEAVALAQKDA